MIEIGDIVTATVNSYGSPALKIGRKYVVERIRTMDNAIWARPLDDPKEDVTWWSESRFSLVTKNTSVCGKCRNSCKKIDKKECNLMEEK